MVGELIKVTAFIIGTSSLFFVICDGPKIIFGVPNFNIKRFLKILFTTVFIVIVSQPIISITTQKIQKYQANNLKEKEAFEKRKKVEQNNNYQKNEVNPSNSENGYADDYETNDTYFKGGGNTEYTQGNDGKGRKQANHYSAGYKGRT